jgi:hypothetical protein
MLLGKETARRRQLLVIQTRKQQKTALYRMEPGLKVPPKLPRK